MARRNATLRPEVEIDINAILQRAEPDVGISADYWEDYEIEDIRLDGVSLLDNLPLETKAHIREAFFSKLATTEMDEALEDEL